MKRVSNWYEDPTGWVCDLNAGWTTFTQIQGATVVANAGPNLYTSRLVTEAGLYFHTRGSGTKADMFGADNQFWFWLGRHDKECSIRSISTRATNRITMAIRPPAIPF